MSKTTASPKFSIIVIFVGTALILLATLEPFNFQWHSITLQAWLDRFDLAPYSLFDFPRNIVLFMPLGGGMAALLAQRGMRRRQIFWLTLLVGFLLTSIVESLQVFVPSRTPSISDILANSLGVACGFVVFELWQERRSVGQWLNQWLSVYKLIAVSSTYFLFMLTLVLVLMYSMQPGHWDPAYPLALGNELSSDRPWQGRLRDLVLLDQAVDAADASLLLAGEISPALIGTVVADYPLVGADGLADRSGTLPNLAWRNERAAAGQSSGMLRLDGVSWLATGTTVAPLARRINESGQFTLAVTLATGDPAQTGPARIMTNSGSQRGRNLTLGQEGDRLILRFRTRLTGENATTPELHIPGIVIDGVPRRIVMSYEGVRLRIYSADPEQSIAFTLAPEVAFVGAFVGIFDRDPLWTIDVDSFPVAAVRILFYSLIFLPLGAMLAVAVVCAAYRSVRSRWVALALVLPALVFEITVAEYGSFAPRIAVIALGMVIMAVAFVITRYFLRLRRGATR